MLYFIHIFSILARFFLYGKLKIRSAIPAIKIRSAIPAGLPLPHLHGQVPQPFLLSVTYISQHSLINFLQDVYKRQEIICGIGKRVPRVYIRDGRVIGKKDYFNDIYEGFGYM